ncbi:hypothetical protein [Pantoea dispersa]
MKKSPDHFHKLSVLTSALFFVLAITWMLMPDKALTAWGVIYSDAAGLVSRRAAGMYAGVSVMFWLARNAAPSAARFALSAGLVTACLIIAATGVYDFVSGHAQSPIFIAVLIETLLAIAFFRIGLKNS